jgi:hypothetical protein
MYTTDLQTVKIPIIIRKSRTPDTDMIEEAA